MRLEQKDKIIPHTINADFNSIKVRLEHGILALSQQISNNFNSIKVRLEPSSSEPFYVQYGNFNSIKVRLEPLKLTIAKAIALFQFHKGAIRTCTVLFCSCI